MKGWANQLSSVAPNVENDDDDADSPPLLLSKWEIEGKKGPILSYSRDCDPPPGIASSKAAGGGRDTARVILHRRCQYAIVQYGSTESDGRFSVIAFVTGLFTSIKSPMFNAGQNSRQQHKIDIPKLHRQTMK
jgi:hypothetical protein